MNEPKFTIVDDIPENKPHWPIPEEFLDDHSIRTYTHLPDTGDVLDDTYARYERKPTLDDDPKKPYFAGEWEDKTVYYQQKERIKRQQAQIAEMQKRLSKLLEKKNNSEDN